MVYPFIIAWGYSFRGVPTYQQVYLLINMGVWITMNEVYEGMIAMNFGYAELMQGE